MFATCPSQRQAARAPGLQLHLRLSCTDRKILIFTGKYVQCSHITGALASRRLAPGSPPRPQAQGRPRSPGGFKYVMARMWTACMRPDLSRVHAAAGGHVLQLSKVSSRCMPGWSACSLRHSSSIAPRQSRVGEFERSVARRSIDCTVHRTSRCPNIMTVSSSAAQRFQAVSGSGTTPGRGASCGGAAAAAGKVGWRECHRGGGSTLRSVACKRFQRWRCSTCVRAFEVLPT